jgi:hypothetical protein
MAMDANEIRRMILEAIPDAEVTIRDLAGDGEILVDLADFHILNLLRYCVMELAGRAFQSPFTGTFR